MIVLAVTILLATAGVAVMPCWRHSAAWGYGPGACAGLLLLGLGTFTALGRTSASDAPTERMAAATRSIVVQASIETE